MTEVASGSLSFATLASNVTMAKDSRLARQMFCLHACPQYPLTAEMPSDTNQRIKALPIHHMLSSDLNLKITKRFFTSILILIAGVSAAAKDYSIPEIAGVISLSGLWAPDDASLVKEQNEGMLRLRPQQITRYIAGFTRNVPLATVSSIPDYLWIQRTPMSTPAITPEQLTAMLPKASAQMKPEVERSPNIISADPGKAHYEQRLGAVVWEGSDRMADGRAVRIRSYMIVTKSCLISINGYATPQTADVVFEEVQGIVSTLKLKEDEKMPQSWTDRLKKLLGSP